MRGPFGEPGSEDVMKRLDETGISEKVLEEIVTLAKEHCVKKVVLFGSRARGDFQRASDIDLAAEGGNVTAFALDVDELTSTLLMYDVVDLGRPVQKELLDAIQSEGIVIYEEAGA